MKPAMRQQVGKPEHRSFFRYIWLLLSSQAGLNVGKLETYLNTYVLKVYNNPNLRSFPYNIHKKSVIFCPVDIIATISDNLRYYF